MQKEILHFRDLILRHETHMAPDVAEAINSTLLGNPGGIRYALVGALQKARGIKALHFFPLRRKEELLSVMAVAERVVTCGNTSYPAFYVRYVSFNPKYYVKDLSQTTGVSRLQQAGTSIMKKGMQNYASEIPFSLPFEGSTAKRMFYAYVEESNLRSMQFTRFFFEKVRSVAVTTYSCLFPKEADGFEELTKAEAVSMHQLLKEYYEGYSFRFFNESDIRKDYYVIRVNNEVVAGVKAGRAQWKLEHIPGGVGKLIGQILPRFPLLKRMFPNGLFTFLTFDTLYARPGFEHLLPTLFKSVCAREKTYAAMIYTDVEDVLYASMKTSRKMGLINKLYQGARVALLVRFINFDSGEKREVSSRPAYVSGFDLC